MPSLKSEPPVDDKRYWRSLERLLESPAVRDAAIREATSDSAGRVREFPDGADSAPDEVSRRTMLTLMGASFTLASLEGCRRPVETIVPYVTGPEYVIPGIPKRYATTLPFGSSAFGVVVESHEGRPTKIEGNELHPSSQGAATTWTQASILGLCDPDRSSRVRHLAAEATEHAVSDWAAFDADLAERRTALEASGGAGLAVLSGAYCSPTLARLAARLAEVFPQAQWVVHEPLGDDNVFHGCRLATGTPCRPVYHLEKARRILALDADILHTESESLAAAKGFARSRKAEAGADASNRLYAVESSLSITGSMADHRIRLKSREIGAFAAALAGELGVEAATGVALPAGVEGKVKAIAADLAGASGGAVVIAGRRQPPEVHALALAINQALGALGQTVTLHDHSDTGVGDATAFAELVEAMRGGSIETLLILGGNPVYTAPADLDFAGALAAVGQSIHLADQFNETSRKSHWHLPEAQFLEAWGDARAADGTLSVVQPLIAPLLNGRSAIEIVDQLANGSARPGHQSVQETWVDLLGAEDFDRQWRRVLHDGVAQAEQLAVAPEAIDAPAINAVPLPAASDESGLELSFYPSRASFDGRFANLSWLQELPDAITKITWDNAALVSPKTAEQFDLTSGDLVSLGYRDRTLDIPIFVLPGQADDSVALALGYGRTAAGRVGDGVGANAYLLRDSQALEFDGGLSLTKVKGSHLLAQTQEHWDLEGRELIYEATQAAYHGGKKVVPEKRKPEKSHQLFPSFDYTKSPQWGLAIDLNACTGCNACVVACQSENNIPVVGKDQVSRGREMHWLRVDRYFTGEPEEPEVVFQPVPCMHCENAPCEQVCPVAATVHDEQGLNAMVYNRCIGTRYCSNNCPYKVRRFNFFNYTKDTPELMKMAMNPDVTVRSRGVMEKCTYCVQRISETRIAAKRAEREVEDGEIKTACQQTCPTDAIVFGDITDADSEVSKWKSSERDYLVLQDLNNRPRTSYLAKLRNPNPDWEGA
ncbi:MAG: TAT-variant-translocated molybdopterin oxidoreductase [Acidobacteriota bacterium]